MNYLSLNLNQGKPAIKLQSGIEFGPYRLERLLGEGGCGEVWEATHRESQRLIALKVLTQIRAESPEALERFKQEGKLAASINHPHCVYVFSADEIEGYPTVAMEVMKGGTLADRLCHGPLNPSKAVDYVLDMISGLEAAYIAGILHRDIKPSNCFLDDDDRVRIGDFGISKSLESQADLTISGTFLGTPFYASPEQIRGYDIDVRSDIYSIGATLYQLITGQPPYSGESALQVMARIVSEEPDPISTKDVEVPRGLEHLIMRMLSRNPEKRPSDYSELKKLLLLFSMRGIRPAGLRRRFQAILFDIALIAVVGHSLVSTLSASLKSGLQSASGLNERDVTSLTIAILWFLYFSLSEGIAGRSLGKYLNKIRVVGEAGGNIGIRKAFVRSLVFTAFGLVLVLIRNAVTPDTGLLDTFYTLGALVFYLFYAPAAHWGHMIMMSPMRPANGYAGFHDLISKTRVIDVIQEEPAEELQKDQTLSKETISTLSTLGVFTLLNPIWESNQQSLWMAYDRELDRKVWIHRYQRTLSHQFGPDKVLSLPGRLRWLRGSYDDKECWDAYGIPSGCHVREWALSVGKRDWGEVRQVLRSTVEALRRGFESEVLPARLSLAHTWISASGNIILLDFPWKENGDCLGSDPVEPVEWRSYLHQLLLWAVAKKTTRTETLDNELPDIPFPEHARPIIEQICSSEESDYRLSDLKEELERIANKPATVGAERRDSPLGVILALAFPCAVVPVFYSAESVIELVTFFMGWLGVAAILSAALAYLMRGGISLRLYRLAVQTSSGQRATRTKCLLRAIIGWSPILTLFFLGTVLSISWAYELGLTIAIWAIMFLGALYAVLKPERGIPDILAGTYLVPV